MQHPAIAPGNIAVVTGAAHGIGRAFATRLAHEGMRVAMLDADTQVETAAEALGAAEGFVCDVSDIDALEAVRDRISAEWGAPSVLINNAATRVGRGLDAPMDEWRQSFEVNLWGVVNGVRTFLPGMQASGKPGLVINLGSKQGITNPPAHPVYNMTKAALRTYTECLEHELRQDPNRQISAHLLVPGFTANASVAPGTPGSWTSEQVVDYLLSALDRRSFYVICPDDEVSEDEDRARIAWTAGDITEDRPPLSRWHPEWKEVYARTRG